MWGTVGMMMMAKGLDLLIVVLGLELLSICIFILVGFHRRIAVSNEASLKYFLMGAFATGFVLYGTALFYGATQLDEPRRDVAATSPPPTPAIRSSPIAFVLLMSGLGFKLAVAPFHGWAPDVYQGAPSPVAGWLSVAPKAATLIALVRIFSPMTPVHPAGLVDEDGGRAVDPLHDHRQRRGHRPARPQADAGLLRHRPRRLHAHRPAHRCATNRWPRSRSTPSPTR